MNWSDFREAMRAARIITPHEAWVIYNIASGEFVGLNGRPELIRKTTSLTSGRSRQKAYHALLARGYFVEIVDEGCVVGQRLTRFAEKKLKIHQEVPTPTRRVFPMSRTRPARLVAL